MNLDTAKLQAALAPGALDFSRIQHQDTSYQEDGYSLHKPRS